MENSDAVQISKAIEYVSSSRIDVENIIVDDAQYIAAFEFMRRAKENGYGKFADIGVNMTRVIDAARMTRKSLNVYFLWHPEQDREMGYKMKTVGKMVDDYLTIEGLFTVVLYTRVVKDNEGKVQYQFVTNSDGEFPGKSPIGLFKDLYIQNDLGLVSRLINEYNEGNNI